MILGQHVYVRKHPSLLAALVAYAAEHPGAVAQVFTLGPRSASVATTRPADAAPIRALGLRLLVHSCYVAHPWSRVDRVRHAAKAILRRELETADALGALGLVVHLAPVPPDDVVAALAAVRLDRYATPVLLENMYSAPYASPDAVRDLFARLDDHPATRGRVRLCVDTSHLWAQGVAVDDPAVFGAYLDAVRPYLGAIHLNDSTYPRGSGRDKHLPVGEGRVWGGGSRSYERALRAGVPVVAEWHN